MAVGEFHSGAELQAEDQTEVGFGAEDFDPEAHPEAELGLEFEFDA